MKNKKMCILLIISMFVIILSGCTNSQAYGGADTYAPSAFESTVADAGASTGGAPGVLTVAWNVVKWPVQFLFGIPKATLNAFDSMFSSADAAGVGQVQVTEGY